MSRSELLANSMLSAGRLDVDQARARVDAGLLSCRKHPERDLLVWNYTAQATFDRAWDEITLACRGLITDPTGRIVARPFPKFFNAEELPGLGLSLPAEPFDVYEKLDGSLIIVCGDDSDIIATRGSFISEQVGMAREILAGEPIHAPGLTLLFELIDPRNRIVVDYGGRRELVLLGAVDPETGEEPGATDLQILGERLGFRCARLYDAVSDFEAIRSLGEANTEGFVVRFCSGFRVKLKLAEYVRLHRLLTGVTPRRVWEVLSSSGSLEDMLRAVPEEFAAWLTDVEADLRGQYAAIETRAKADFLRVPAGVSRKEQAEVIKGAPFPAVLFRMLDGKGYERLIWQAIYKAAAAAFRCDSEAA